MSDNPFYLGKKIRIESLPHGVKKLILSEPKLRNAVDAIMIEEILQALQLLVNIKNENEMRLLILEGEGSVFCAGANLNYMKDQGKKNENENKEDAKKLGKLFYLLASFPAPVVCVVQGAAMGGGLGLAVCADIVLSEEKSIFCTSEVLLGIIPAVISPYIIRKVGAGKASPFMLSGQKLNAKEAYDCGLVHEITTQENLQESLNNIIKQYLRAGPQAARKTKELILNCTPLPHEQQIHYCVNAIASVRITPEAQMGLNCFFNKETPDWCKNL